MSEIDLLPRADIPVLFNDFKCKADAVWSVVDSLVVTDVSQKEAMALARKTRLTLREIRIAVEHKRVELGEGHLKEIQKVNGAARAIREFIEPLEARLLDQETFADRAEAMRIATLADSRLVELKALKVCQYPTDLGTMKQEDYDAYIARLRAEKAELEESNRLRVEAEKQLAEVRAEAQKRAIELQLELKAESDRLKAEAAAILNAKLEQQRKEAEALEIQRTAEHKAEREEWERQNAEAERVRLEQEAKLRNERSVAEGIRLLERVEAEKRLRVEREEKAAYLKQLAEREALVAAEQAEQNRIRDEQFAVLEAELAQERAAKQAEADAARKLALAPDVEQLRGFSRHLKKICQPVLKTPEAEAALSEACKHFGKCVEVIDAFCRE